MTVRTISRSALATALALIWASVGCDVEEPAPPTGPGDSEETSRFSQDRTVLGVADIIASHGLEEGDEVTLEIAEMESVDMFERRVERDYTYRVVDGELLAVDGGPELPGRQDEILPLGVADAEDVPAPYEVEDSLYADQQGSGDFMEDVRKVQPLRQIAETAPPQMVTVHETAIDQRARLDTTAFLNDLFESGITVEYNVVEPPPTGATAVVELYLDHRTRASVEQFDDAGKLAIWYRANRQAMQDRGMDPDEHMVLRGMTLVRFGPDGHLQARERALAIPTIRID